MTKQLLLLLTLLGMIRVTQAQASPFQAAADYSRERQGDVVLVVRDAQIIFEEYQNGYSATQPHLLASGTKSFVCALAVLAQTDGLLNLDERVADTLTEWRAEPEKSQITIRQLLSLTSGQAGGLEFLNGQLARPDRVATALEIPMGAPVGEAFLYGPASFYIFQAVLQRKLGRLDTVDYLRQRVLDPIGMANFLIGRDDEGAPNWAGGVVSTARSWMRYGLLILNNGNWNGTQLLDAELLHECFIGTNANPYYGLTWWLLYDLETPVNLGEMAIIAPTPGDIPAGVTLGETEPLVLIAAGAGQQRLYIIPEDNVVVVRLGRQDDSFDDVAFLRLIRQGLGS